MSVNKIILVGRLGADPESQSFPNGGSICNLRVATSENWKDKKTGDRKERTEWHRCVLRDKLGEIAQQYLHKGSQIYLEGAIRTKKWQDENGQDRYSNEIMCNQMKMLGGSRDSGYSEASNPDIEGKREISSAGSSNRPIHGPPADDNLSQNVCVDQVNDGIPF